MQAKYIARSADLPSGLKKKIGKNIIEVRYFYAQCSLHFPGPMGRLMLHYLSIS